MFSFINSLCSLGLAILIGIPAMAFIAYITATFVQGLFGGPIWLWMVIVLVIGLGAAVEEYNKIKVKEEN